MEKEPAFWLVGAHGGAGVTALAHMIAPAGDSGTEWPDFQASCVIVCSSTVDNLDQAHQLIATAPAGREVLGLVVVARTSGKPPRAISAKIRVLESITTVWPVPYIKSLVNSSVSELPTWEPTLDNQDTRKKKRHSSHQVPQPVAELGDTLCRAFVHNYVAEATEN